MQIEILDFVSGARAARGVAVVIDVFRAFSTACYAVANGARRIVPVADVDEARTMKRQDPSVVTLGERHAKPLEGFDFGNSPALIETQDFHGKTLVHTTHSGTQGLANALEAEVVLTGSLVNAAAICAHIRSLRPETVSLVRMGHEARERCAEDDLCAEIIADRLRGAGADYTASSVRDRLRTAPSAEKFFDPAAPWAPERDFELCTELDRFNFVLRLTRPKDGTPAHLEVIAL